MAHEDGGGENPPGRHLPPRVGRRQVAEAIVRPIFAAVILLAGYFLLPIDKASSANLAGLIVGSLLLLAFVVWEIRHFVHSPYPVATAVEMLVALAAFYIVAFAATYFLLSEYGHDNFNERLTRIDALYFCLTVFTTTGFGDISASSQPARVIVSIQMASTLVLLGLGLRFLNILVTARARR
ncbi:ion channel [Gordonia sp. ABSL11-1]|uniref:potassium channel family protein n=1 Tax=Gordonia sp. ABSL11-1 TaxID=3053924 RepID=UPI002573A919|nr:potassium channel family protein [Gordonia sp. ABSL11-1]MDL9946410.1 ion channel [Gordonia sp. ABSL11-1]